MGDSSELLRATIALNEDSIRMLEDQVDRLTAENAAEHATRNAIARHSAKQDAEIERLTAEVSGKDKEIALLLAVSDAARDLHKNIMLDLYKHDHWMQFEFTADPVDLYWVHQLQLALQAIDKDTLSGTESPK